MRMRRIATLLALVTLMGAGCGSAASATPTPVPAVVATVASAATSTATPAAVAPRQTIVATMAPPAPAQPAPSAQLAATGEPLVIHLVLHPVNDTVGSLTGCSNAGRCQGDFMVGYDPLVDAETGKEVGTFAYECFLVEIASTLYHCPGVTITLAGRGQIVFTEVIEHEPGKPAAISPITGGTGEFLGATGTVTAKVLPGAGDFVIKITR